jgi:hypothetical protein
MTGIHRGISGSYGAVGAVRRHNRLVVLTRHIDAYEPPAARLSVGQQAALRAPQHHRANIRRHTGRIYWPCALLQTDYAARRDTMFRGLEVAEALTSLSAPLRPGGR